MEHNEYSAEYITIKLTGNWLDKGFTKGRLELFLKSTENAEIIKDDIVAVASCRSISKEDEMYFGGNKEEYKSFEEQVKYSILTQLGHYLNEVGVVTFSEDNRGSKKTIIAKVNAIRRDRNDET